MSQNVPTDRRYLESHEWAKQEDDGGVKVGITAFAQDELGDVVFVEFPPVGDQLSAEEAFGVVESIKAVSDLYAPISGEVTATNERLFDEPELVNDDPYGDGWMIEIAPENADDVADLLDSDAYQDQIA